MPYLNESNKAVLINKKRKYMNQLEIIKKGDKNFVSIKHEDLA